MLDSVLLISVLLRCARRPALLPFFTYSPSPYHIFCFFSSFILRRMNYLFSNVGVACSFFLLFCTLATPVHAAQQPKTMVFQWKFAEDPSTELPTCRDLGIIVKPFNAASGNATGVPPYYMLGYATNGITRSTLVGNSLDNLKWTVDYPVGTELALSLVDSEGTSGGIPPKTYTVSLGQTTNCVVDDPKKDFTVKANRTTTINTCEPWRLTITGGTKPYNVTFLQLNSPNVTNVTMGASDDAYVYINRGIPNQRMIAAVNDFTGRFAFGAPSVMPQGSSNPDCIGLNSESGSAAEFDKEEAEEADARAAARRKRTAIIAGTVVPISLVIIAGIAMWYFLWYKPRSKRPREIDLLDSNVKPYTETGSGQVLSINAFLNDAASSPGSSPKHPPGLGHPTMESIVCHSAYGELEHPFDPYSQSDNTSSTSQRATSGASRHSEGRPGFANFPVRRPTVKAAEAGIDAHPPDIAVTETASGSHPTRVPGPSVTRTTSVGQTNAGEPELIIQHRDGGPGRVRELPPPYADRGTAEP
ncbi:hypothetical protein E1B28_003272 [Marasmius oreades]|uniref:Uncharacterized protein n=1 Tax=Marasmius oreades TaxID=181124 RepID=A0A9P7UN96_9AGAR|nr:uncharacterized protein E1B28_003272 [Marasmius oreades]KAG7085729.1 hypothetical protein E1B28_003272 [Marasmius oreades]